MFVVADCDCVTISSSANMSKDNPPPAILWDENAAVGFI